MTMAAVSAAVACMPAMSAVVAVRGPVTVTVAERLGGHSQLAPEGHEVGAEGVERRQPRRQDGRRQSSTK